MPTRSADLPHRRAQQTSHCGEGRREEIDEFYATRVVFDIEGNQREVIDAKDRIVMRYDYDMLGTRIHQASMEAGERWMLNDVAGNRSTPGTAGITVPHDLRRTAPAGRILSA